MKTTSLICIVLLFTAGLYGQEKDLSYFIQQGIGNSPALKDLLYQQQANRIDSQRLRASYRPQVSAQSANSYAPVIKGYGYENAITNGGNFSQLITASQRFAGKANISNQYNGIALLSQSMAASGKITEQDIRRSVTAQYISAYGSLQQYLFNKEVADLLSKEDSLLKKLTQSNVYRQTDYLTFLVTLQQQQFAVKQSEGQYQTDLAALNYISGITDTSFTILTAPALQPAILPAPENSIFFETYRIDSLRWRNADDSINFSYKPKLGVYADAGHVSTFTIQPYKNFGVSAGISLTVPIYDGGQKKMLHDKNAIARLTTSVYRDYFLQQYNQQVMQLQQQLQLTEALLRQSTEQLKYTNALIEANGKLLLTGESRIADLVIAINSYLAARNNVTQNSIAKLQIINQINYWDRKK